MATRRQVLSGSLATLLATVAACNGDTPSEPSTLETPPLDTDAMSSAMSEVFDGSYSTEVTELLGLLEELRTLIEDDLPATAAMMAATFNHVALPMVQGMRDALEATDQTGVISAFAAHEDTARTGLAEMQRLLALVDDETAGMPSGAAEADLSEYQHGLAESAGRLTDELAALELDGPSIRALQASQHTEARRISAGDVGLRDDLDLAFTLSEVEAATKAVSVKGLFDAEECGDLSELKFWYTAGSAVWKFIGLISLILGGWSAMTGITAGLAVALLGASFALWFIWLLLIILFVWQLAKKLNTLIEMLDACACELRGTE